MRSHEQSRLRISGAASINYESRTARGFQKFQDTHSSCKLFTKHTIFSCPSINVDRFNFMYFYFHCEYCSYDQGCTHANERCWYTVIQLPYDAASRKYVARQGTHTFCETCRGPFSVGNRPPLLALGLLMASWTRAIIRYSDVHTFARLVTMTCSVLSNSNAVVI